MLRNLDPYRNQRHHPAIFLVSQLDTIGVLLYSIRMFDATQQGEAHMDKAARRSRKAYRAQRSVISQHDADLEIAEAWETPSMDLPFIDSYLSSGQPFDEQYADAVHAAQ